MSLKLFIAVVTLLVAASAAAQIYRWVDEDGVVHYSDQAVEGAEIIHLPESNRAAPRSRPSVPRETARRGGESGDQGDADDRPFSYEALSVATPAEEQTLWNIAGTLNVSLNLQPSLQQGHRVRVYLDGQSQLVDALQFELPEVWRGAHTLQAEVLDSTGQLMIRSEPRRFFVQQTSIRN